MQQIGMKMQNDINFCKRWDKAVLFAMRCFQLKNSQQKGTHQNELYSSLYSEMQLSKPQLRAKLGRLLHKIIVVSLSTTHT